MGKPKSTKTSREKIETLVLVTAENRKFCVKLGRILYVYTQTTTGFNLNNTFDVRPRIKKGWNVGWSHLKGLYKFFAPEDEDREQYANGFDEVITFCIKNKMLYMNPEENLIKYE